MGLPVSIVVITRDRASLVDQAVGRLLALPERPPVIVVDNGSGDGTPALVRRRHARARVLALPVNRGAAARQIGACAATTPYVAFADDDSWWAPGALGRAVTYLEHHPGVALVAGRVLVGPEERLDPTSAAMAASPLGRPVAGGGRAILGFLACSVVVRRQPFLDVGGFPERFGVGGEEEPVAIDLASRGWELVYLDDVVVHHHPAPGRDPAGRQRVQARNALWTAWSRRSPRTAARATLRALRGAGTDPDLRRGLADAVKGSAWALRHRQPAPPAVEQALRRLAVDR